MRVHVEGPTSPGNGPTRPDTRPPGPLTRVEQLALVQGPLFDTEEPCYLLALASDLRYLQAVQRGWPVDRYVGPIH